MSQESVLSFLKEKKAKWVSSKEISKETRISYCSILHNLCALRKTGFVEFKITKPYKTGTIMYMYRYKM